MHLYNRIIVHNGHIVCRQSFETFYGERLVTEHTDGLYDDSMKYYIQTESNPYMNKAAWCHEYRTLLSQIDTIKARETLGYPTRDADKNLHIEEAELIHALTVYLDVLKQGK